MKDFNVNDIVKVELTPFGYEILDKYYSKLLSDYNEKGNAFDEHYFDKLKRPEVDEEGFTEFQLWTLMKIFGKYMNIGNKLPFNTIILINDKDLSNHESNNPLKMSLNPKKNKKD